MESSYTELYANFKLQVNNMQMLGLCIFKFAILEAKLFINFFSEAEKGQFEALLGSATIDRQHQVQLLKLQTCSFHV